MRWLRSWLVCASACGSVASPVADAGDPASDGAQQAAPGDLVWACSLSGLGATRVQVAAGRAVVAGEFNTPIAMDGISLTPTPGNYDMAVAAFTTDDASLSYANGFGDTGYEAGFVDTLDASGAPIVHGLTNGPTNLGTGPLAAGGGSDTFIGRYGNGPPTWLHRVATTADEQFEATSPGPNGSVYAIGDFSGTVTIDNATLTTAGGEDVMLFRFDAATGAVQSALRFGGTSNDDGSGIVWRSPAVYISGQFDGTLPTSAGSVASAGSFDVFAAKLDEAGAVQWIKSFGSTGNDSFVVIGADEAGGVYIAGRFQNQVAFGAVNLVSSGGFDAFLAKLRGSDGAVQWATAIGSTGDDGATEIAVSPAGEVCVIGTAGAALNIGGGNQGGKDAFLACFNADGTLRWKRIIGSLMDDYGFGVAFGPDGMLYATVSPAAPVDLGVPVKGPASYAGLLLKLQP